MGDLDPPSNTWFLGPNRVFNPNGILIGANVSAGLISVTDRQTDRDGNNRPLPASTYVVLRYSPGVSR